jgi:LAO/AO transport system kinase
MSRPVKAETAATPVDWTALDPRRLGRLLTAIEERTPAGRELVSELQGRSWPGVTVGITGPPGGGKSTLIGACVRELRRRGESVGVLAVDPSSPRGGGALLGDRVRMMEFAGDPRVVIRSLAARGSAGGVTPAVADMARLLRAAGFTWVLVETVGVGQGEWDVATQVDLTVVVQAPGLGDDIQAMKKGLLECGDLLVVNKADRPGADTLARDLAAWSATEPDRVLRTSAKSGEGVAALLDAIERRRRERPAGGDVETSRREEIRRLALLHLTRRLEQRLRTGPLPSGSTWQAAETLAAELLKADEPGTTA